jgi:hypothetical protein
MWPKDGSDPRAPFVGIDFTILVRNPGVFDHVQLEKCVEEAVRDFYQQHYIAARPCFEGGLGSAFGGSLIEMLNWIRENWEFLTSAVAALSAAVFKVRNLAARERTRITNGVIDPYRPGIVVTVSPRTGSLGDDVTDGDREAFPQALAMLPQLHAALANKVPTHDFSLRAIRRGRDGAFNAFFKLKATTERDVAMMIRKIEKLDARQTSAPTVLLYRQFGRFRRFEVSKKPGDFFRLFNR